MQASWSNQNQKLAALLKMRTSAFDTTLHPTSVLISFMDQPQYTTILTSWKIFVALYLYDVHSSNVSGVVLQPQVAHGQSLYRHYVIPESKPSVNDLGPVAPTELKSSRN